MGRRSITADRSHYVLNATITIRVHVLPNATSAIDLAIYPVTVGVLQMPILLTSKKALEQVRRLHATNVGIKGTTREIFQSEGTKTMKTKSKVPRHAEWVRESKPKKMQDAIEIATKLMNKKICTLAECQTENKKRLKKTKKKDKIGSKPDKNGKRSEAEKSQKQLQLKEEEKPKKTKKEWPKTHARIKSY
nr:hypothetical protein [Tanacetum cinerariifolium]